VPVLQLRLSQPGLISGSGLSSFVSRTVCDAHHGNGIRLRIRLGRDQQKSSYRNLRKDYPNMTKSSNETYELTAGELDTVAGGVKFGPITIEWSKGCGCVDVGFAGLGGFYIGAGGAGASWGSHYIKLF
jgi:hypothetical protein